MKPRTSIITGAGGGIGSALAKRLAYRGDNLVLVDLDVDRLAIDSSDRCLHVRADMAVESQVKDTVQETLDTFGRIDYFANNAGIESPVNMIEDQDVETLDRLYRVNVRGVFLGLAHVLPRMKSQGEGAIVNTSSLAGIIGSPGLSPYTMSKHAVIGLTRSAAAEAAPHGVRVNAVLPGPVDTVMMARIEESTGDAAGFRRTRAASIPMGRYATPDEVAAVMLFLLSSDSSYVNSSLYTVDGGLSSQ